MNDDYHTHCSICLVAHRDLIMILNKNIYGILDTKFVKVTTSQAMVRSQRT